MGKFKVTYDGCDLTDYFDVMALNRDGSLNMEVSTEAKTNYRGVRHTGNNSQLMIIQMDIYLYGDIINKRRKITQLLDTAEPMQLVFSDEPDKYYLAIGSLAMSDTRIESAGTITWQIMDGLAHATTETTFTASPNDDGVLEATIINNGTASVPISYEIKHKSDNGYIGIVSSEGAMEYGSREELDTESYQESDILKVSSTFADWPADTGANAQNANIKTGGKLAEKDFSGKNGLYLSDAGTGEFWHGGMRTLTLPADSQGGAGADKLNCYFNHVFVAGLQSQTGIFMVNLLDANNKMVCSYFVYKSSPASGKASANMLVGGNSPKIWKSFEFVPYPDEKKNQFAASAGHCSINKNGDYFTFYWRGQAIGGVTVPELKDVKIAKAQYFIGQYGTRGLSGKDYMSYNYLRNISFTKLNVDKTVNVPNRYMTGDVIKIDGDAQSISVNGMDGLNDEVIGTDYFKAPAGQSLKVQILPSSWCSVLPSVTVKIRKAWL